MKTVVKIVKQQRKIKRKIRLDRSEPSDESEGSDLIIVKSHHSHQIKMRGFSEESVWSSLDQFTGEPNRLIQLYKHRSGFFKSIFQLLLLSTKPKLSLLSLVFSGNMNEDLHLLHHSSAVAAGPTGGGNAVPKKKKPPI